LAFGGSGDIAVFEGLARQQEGMRRTGEAHHHGGDDGAAERTR
jgi:hypothetical protein